MIRRILPTVIDTKYHLILSEERLLAKATALELIETQPISAWEVMIPFIFIYNVLRIKRAREVFILNFLFTKRLALEAALNMMKKSKPRQEVISEIENKTSKVLASDKKGIYSERIRQKQMREIDLLLEHYLKLLDAEGKDYPSLVKNVYKTKENYTRFLNQLKQAEKEVNRAALQTLERTEIAYQIASGMEKAADRIRTAEAEKIFA